MTRKERKLLAAARIEAMTQELEQAFLNHIDKGSAAAKTAMGDKAEVIFKAKPKERTLLDVAVKAACARILPDLQRVVVEEQKAVQTQAAADANRWLETMYMLGSLMEDRMRKSQ